MSVYAWCVSVCVVFKLYLRACPLNCSIFVQVQNICILHVGINLLMVKTAQELCGS